MPGKAMVVVLRSSGLGFAVQSRIFDVTDIGTSLIGVVAAKTKVAYHADPGKCLFMAISESASFATADLIVGRTHYYVEVTLRMGVWKAHFFLEHVPGDWTGLSEFRSFLSDCRWVENTAESRDLAVENPADIRSKQLEYYLDWVKQTALERPSLVAVDGV